MKNEDKDSIYKGFSKMRKKENIKIKESFNFFILFFIIILVNPKEYKMNNNKRKIDSENYIILKTASTCEVRILSNINFSTSISDIYLNEEKKIIILKIIIYIYVGSSSTENIVKIKWKEKLN